MIRRILQFLLVAAFFPPFVKAQGADCATAAPFCTGTTYTFPASTNTTAPTGPDYDCLGTQPNPAWYFLQIATSGDVELGISQVDAQGGGQDVDFICWGPFVSPAAGCASGLGGSSVIDCSYSTAAVETCNITSAVTGEFYLLLLTNFAGVAADISLSQSNAGASGAGSTNCDILCSLDSISALPGLCSASSYSVSGKVYYTNPPLAGTLTVTNSCSGATEVFNAPFNTGFTDYTLTGLSCNGLQCTVTAVFSGDEFCTNTKDFVAPTESFIDCPVTASNNSPFCGGSQLNLTALSIPNVTYSWTGPDGFFSTEQNPVINDVPQSMAGDYIVTVTHASPACTAKDTTTVDIFPTALADFLVTPEDIYTLEPIAYFNNLSDSSISWLWEFGDTSTSVVKNPNHTYADTGHYAVTLHAHHPSGCNDSITKMVIVQDIVTLYIPSAFTPNDNGLNDVFTIRGYGMAEDNFELFVFDRWGNLVFKTRNIKESWNGSVDNKGKTAQTDTYVYRIVYKDLKGKKHSVSGPVTVLR